MLEKSKGFGIETHHLSIDFKAAYDSINRSRLYLAVEEVQVPKKHIHLVKATMKDMKCQIRIKGALSEPLNIRNGIRQGDALACLLFNISLEKVIRDADINIRGNIFYKSIQILAYADDIDFTGRSQAAMKEAFTSLEKAGREMHLDINQGKTKYMPVTKRDCSKTPSHIATDSYRVETVHSFTYLGSEVNCKNDMSVEIRKRILAANECFHGLRTHFRSHLISRKTKTLLYKVLVRPVVTCGSETWMLTKADERSLGIFERKILRCIFGAVLENGQWRKIYNFELYKLYDEPDLTKYIRINRLRWAGHVTRMSDDQITERVFIARPEGKRGIGRPKMRWRDSVGQDAEALGERNWGRLSMNKEEWKKLLRKARAHTGL
jgi:sorting nexin-29